MNMIEDEIKADSFFEPILTEAQNRFGQAATPEGQKRLNKAALSRCRALSLEGLAAYAAHLRAEQGEWPKLWAQALLKSGSLMRPVGQFDVLKELISQWALMAPERELKVLSLGSGFGLESVSLAIALEEAGLRAKNWQVEIYALDINPEAIKSSEEGLFTTEDMQWLNQGQSRKWFAARSGGFSFKADLAPPIKSFVANVYEPATWPFFDLFSSFDLIFCRGLTYDAPPEAISQLLTILQNCLSASGFIFTDPGEFLPFTSEDFFLEERLGVTYYRRGVLKIKANRHHQARRPKKACVSPESQEKDILPARELQILSLAQERLAEGQMEEARELAQEAVLAALDRERPAPEAWKIIAKIEESLGRADTAKAAYEAALSAAEFSD